MRLRKGLTLKQKRFIDEYIKDGNATRAVQKAYPKIKTYGGQRTMGSKLVTNANIQERIEQVLNEAGLTPELIVKELKGLIVGEDRAEKNKALRTAAEILGLIGKGSLVATQVSFNQEFKLSDDEKEELQRIRDRIASHNG